MEEQFVNERKKGLTSFIGILVGFVRCFVGTLVGWLKGKIHSPNSFLSSKTNFPPDAIRTSYTETVYEPIPDVQQILYDAAYEKIKLLVTSRRRTTWTYPSPQVSLITNLNLLFLEYTYSSW